MRTLFLVDVPDLFAAVRKKWPNHNLDYDLVVNAYKGIECEIQTKIAYIDPERSRLNSFYNVLKRAGFMLDDFDPVLMALRVAESVGFYDALVVGSTNPNVVQILAYARSKGMYTFVFGVDVSSRLGHHAEVFELDEAFVRDRAKTAQQVDLPTDGTSTVVEVDG